MSNHVYYSSNKFKTQTLFYLLQQQIENAGNINFTPAVSDKFLGLLLSVFLFANKKKSYIPPPNIGLA